MDQLTEIKDVLETFSDVKISKIDALDTGEELLALITASRGEITRTVPYETTLEESSVYELLVYANRVRLYFTFLENNL